MNINRHNYEEYFILYMDNELSHDEKKMVDLFVQQNPDLEEELTMLLQSRLIADTSLHFDEKEILLRTETGFSPSTELLLHYTDNELSAEEKLRAEQLIITNPSLKTEWDYLQKVKLQPEENIVFPDKSVLYRKEEPVRIIYFNWKRIAVAAALLLAVSTAAFIIFSDKKETDAGYAAETSKGITPSAEEKQQSAPIKNENLAAAINTKETPATPKEQLATKKETRSQPKNTQSEIIKENTSPSLADTQGKNGNNLPEPTYNPNMKRPIESTNNLAELNMPEKKALTIPEEKISIQPVTPAYAHSLQSSNELIDVEQPEKKNALRGLLRKVTRTFEKTTNIKATDDEDRLLVAGLAIKL